MQITPEMKVQLEEQKKQCIFCKLISGEMESKKVFEDDKTLAILDIYPAKKGHTVFMLKEHYPMPAYIPGDEFAYKFGLVSSLSKAVKSAIVATGMDIFIAIGGVAGQQVAHFLVHLLPRDNGDGFFNFFFDKRKFILDEKGVDMLKNNFPIMMKNHFGRNPAQWHSGKGDLPGYLADIYENSTVIYEDEKILTIIPEKGVVSGHLEIYSKTEEKYIENLSQEDSSHLFFAASLASTAVFEGLGAQGTNIIVKSGDSDDNPGGKLCVHIFPRKQDDSLQSMMWQPKQPSYDLDSIAKKIKDKTWKIKHKEDKKPERKAIIEPEIIKIREMKSDNSSEDEIRKAIESMKK
jgi:histidine triad (HIT) family protein